MNSKTLGKACGIAVLAFTILSPSEAYSYWARDYYGRYVWVVPEQQYYRAPSQPDNPCLIGGKPVLSSTGAVIAYNLGCRDPLVVEMAIRANRLADEIIQGLIDMK